MILGINNFNILKPNRKTVQPNRLSYAQQVNLSNPIKDTVQISFAGSITRADSCSPRLNVCKDVAVCAEPAKYYLDSVLEKYLSPIMKSEKDVNGKKFSVFKIDSRIKKPHSIREKVCSKYEKHSNKNTDQFTDAVFKELESNFERNPAHSEKDVKAIISNVVKYTGTPEIMSAYHDVSYYFDTIIDYLRNGYYNIDSFEEKKRNAIFDSIVERLEDSAPKDLDEEQKYINPNNFDGIKYYARDIVGARIIMQEAAPEYTSQVINALKQAVIDKKLKITSIENNVPAESQLPAGKSVSDYVYASEQQLKALANESGAELITNESKSGYLAIHINIDLDMPILRKYNSRYGSYGGEIQILGKNVEQLKSLEDLCYKLKDGKKVSHPAYNPFRDHFFSYYNDDLRSAFDDYTYAAYLRQRELLPGSAKRNFLTLKEAKMDGIIPPNLDFNVLRDTKSRCDSDYSQAMKKDEKKVLSSNVPEEIRRDQDIKNIKKDIAYQMKHNG